MTLLGSADNFRISPMVRSLCYLEENITVILAKLNRIPLVVIAYVFNFKSTVY